MRSHEVSLSQPETWNIGTPAPTFRTARFPRTSVLRQMGPLLGREMTDARRRRLARQNARLFAELAQVLELGAEQAPAAE